MSSPVFGSNNNIHKLFPSGSGLPPLETGDGGGNDGRMEARVAKLETAVEYIQRDVSDLRADVKAMRDQIHGIRTTDFRTIFGAIIFVALGLAGLMAKGFNWI